MAKSARRAGKGKAAVTPSGSSSGISTPSSETGPLPPFTQIPDSLSSFVQALSPKEVYLVHVDTSPHEIKKQTFIVPAFMNAIIAVIIAARAYMVRAFYPALLVTVLGFASPTTLDTSAMSTMDMAKTILYRMGNVILDYFLVLVFLPWPIRFILGPVKWRRTIGFRGHEIIVRRSQSIWSKNLVRNRWIRDDEASRDKIIAAVTPERIQEKPGYMLVDADWDLDYNAMIRAHELVDPIRKGDALPLDEFRTAVLVNNDADGWLIWHVGDEDITTGTSKATVEGKTEGSSDQRDQILAFREKLAAMGKEDLFFRWVELIQFESSQPGGFTPERQKSAMIQAKQVFEEGDVDFARLWQDVGGIGFSEEID